MFQNGHSVNQAVAGFSKCLLRVPLIEQRRKFTLQGFFRDKGFNHKLSLHGYRYRQCCFWAQKQYDTFALLRKMY